MEELAGVWETISDLKHNHTIASLMQGSNVNQARLAKIAREWEEQSKMAFAEGAASRNPKPRNLERDAEVVRLKKEKPRRTPNQIAALIRTHPGWTTMENGKPFTGGAAKAIIKRARDRGELP